MPIDDAAWIIAFIKWCLGEPPILILPDKLSRTIQSNSRVHLHLTIEKSPEVKVWTQDIVGSISDLWSNSHVTVLDFNGMIHLPNLAARLMARLGSETCLEYRAGREAISLRCLPVLDRFRRIESQSGYEMPNISISQGSIFANQEVIAHTLADFLGQSPAHTRKVSPENTLVEDIPSIMTVRKKFATYCQCEKCLNIALYPKEKCSLD